MRHSTFKYVSVGFGGAIGASLRYTIGLWMGNSTVIFPWDTLIINITGAFALSFLLFLPATKKNVPPVLLTGITTGILGAYTTFSTFMIETVQLFEHNRLVAVSYLLISFFGGLLSSFAGYKLARSLPDGENVYD